MLLIYDCQIRPECLRSVPEGGEPDGTKPVREEPAVVGERLVSSYLTVALCLSSLPSLLHQASPLGRRVFAVSPDQNFRPSYQPVARHRQAAAHVSSLSTFRPSHSQQA